MVGPKLHKPSLIIIYILVSLADPLIGSDCLNENFNIYRGRIQSVGYPQPSPSNLCRQWSISSGQNDVITMSFSDLDIPMRDPKNCSDSFMQIGPLPLRTICGVIQEGIPEIYISNRSHAWIRYQTKTTLIGRGFSLYYISGPRGVKRCHDSEFLCRSGKCIPEEWLCNGVSECEDNSDEEPCSTGTKRLTTPGPFQCGSDRFGCVSYETGRYACFSDIYLCDGIPHCETGKDEIDCDKHLPCVEFLDGPKGTMLSPNFPDIYPPNSDCLWRIHVSHGAKIQLRFVTFELAQSYKDSLVVYDGSSENADIKGQYTWRNKPKIIESSRNDLYIVFHSGNDGGATGFNATYQEKGKCLDNQAHCGRGEDDCYNKQERCDFIWNCRKHGGDESGCFKCDDNSFACSLGNKQCYKESDRCNGVGQCFHNNDEMNCPPELCGPHNGTFLCHNTRCIYESWRCDGANDCGDNSDETDCTQVPSVKVITAAVIGSLICALLLVIAFGCTCKLHALRMQEHRGSNRYVSPLTRIQQEIWSRQSAPPPYNEAMLTSRPYDEAVREYINQMQEAASRGGQTQDSLHAPDAPMGRSVSGQQGNENPGGVSAEDGGNTTSSPDTNDDDSMLDLAESPSHNTSQNSDSDCDLLDPSNVEISLATGLSAQWRRRRRVKLPSGALPVAAVVPVSSVTVPLPSCDDADRREISVSSSRESVIISLDEEDKDNDTANQNLPTAPPNLRRTLRSHDPEGSECTSLDSESLEMGSGSVNFDDHIDEQPLLSA